MKRFADILNGGHHDEFTSFNAKAKIEKSEEIYWLQTKMTSSSLFLPADILRLIHDHADILTQRRMEKALKWPCLGIQKISPPKIDLFELKNQWVYRDEWGPQHICLLLTGVKRYLLYIRHCALRWKKDWDTDTWFINETVIESRYVDMQTANERGHFHSLLYKVSFNPFTRDIEEMYRYAEFKHSPIDLGHGYIGYGYKYGVLAKYTGNFGDSPFIRRSVPTMDELNYK